MEAPRALAGEGTDAETIVTLEAMPEGIVGSQGCGVAGRERRGGLDNAIPPALRARRAAC